MKKQKKIIVRKAKERVVEKTTPFEELTVNSVNPLLYSLIITGAFFIIALIGILHHEMWRDEHQAWLVARDAHSFSQLFQNLRYEGNPALWHILLYFITSFTHDPVYMQYLHLVIACGFIFVFNRFSEIKILYKIMFSFGYFTLYEYTLISRSYGLGILLIFIACALYKKRYSNYILIFIILGLLANVTIFSAILALGVGGILMLDYLIYQEKSKNTILRFGAGMLIFTTCFILSIYQIIPEKDNTFPSFTPDGLFDTARWVKVFSRLFLTYLYIPEIADLHFWNSNVYFKDNLEISAPVWKWLSLHPDFLFTHIYLPALIILISIVVFIRKPLVLLLYIGTTTGLLSVYYYTNLMFLRYCGLLLIVLVVCYWLAKYYPDKEFKSKLLKIVSALGRKIQMPFFAFVLFANFIGAIIAFSKDYKAKFSVGKDAAEYLKMNKLDNITIAGIPDFIFSPLATYLDKKIYYPQMTDYGSFCIWNSQRQNEFNIQKQFSSLINLMNSGKEKVLLIRNSLPTISPDNGKHNINLEHALIAKDIKLDLIKIIQAGIVENEVYYIYLVQRIDPAKENLTNYPLIN